MAVIMFVFCGRKANIELALPHYRRILDENPDTEIHLWDLCRDPADSKYLRTITGINRLTVRTEFYDGSGKATRGQNRVWNHYAGREYRHARFVKADDDVLWLDTDRYQHFVDSITEDAITSALVINNGACSQTIPALAAAHQQFDLELLDVHKSAHWAEYCHRWFLRNHAALTNQPADLIPTGDWLSINCIAYAWDTGVQIAKLIGIRTPHTIAGRVFQPRGKVGDEGAVNMLPRRINTGFTAAHLTFGPQHFDPDTLDELRAAYSELGA